jgi:hypothetical protein
MFGRLTIITLIAGTLMFAISPALAQDQDDVTSRPTLGGVGVRPPTQVGPTFGPSSSDEILRHRSPIGAPCLTVYGSSRSHIANPNVYDHVISAKNSCAQRIAIKVCYYKSLDCMSMEIPGGERKEAVLGTLPGAKEFRYEFHERF